MKIKFEVKRVIYEKEDFKVIEPVSIYYIDEETKKERNLRDYTSKILVRTNKNILEEETIVAEVKKQISKKYGVSYEIQEFESNTPALKYNEIFLKGCGLTKLMARKIIDVYGEKSIEKIKENVDNILSIKGISKKKAEKIREEVVKKSYKEQMINVMMMLEIDIKTAFKIYDEYYNSSIDMIKKNIYDIEHLSFHKADRIFLENLNGDKKDERRIKAIVKDFISKKIKFGDMYIDYDSIFELANEDINDYELISIIDEMIREKKLVKEDDRLYLTYYNYIENNLADLILDKHEELKKTYNKEDIKDIIKNSNLNNEQEESVVMALNNSISVLTGGPGTGKTHTINTIIRAFKSLEKVGEVKCLAPTGKAAKRMTEMTGMEAETIHRALGLFEDAEELKLIEADLIIIDEASMIDAYLFMRLLENLQGKLLLVGDYNQLPSIGAGNVLKDIINSDIISKTNLNKIYRQDEKSLIVKNSKLLIEEKDFILSDDSDFFFIKREGDYNIKNTINKCINKLKNRFSINDIQVLTSFNDKELGSKQFNLMMQENHNSNKLEGKFKIGDKVIHTNNNYDLGVYNGETGIITNIFDGIITVDFGDKMIEYEQDLLDELELAYSLTIHKSQGSEYKVVIIPISKSNKILNTKNLLYTGITRAREMVVLVGDKEELSEIKNRLTTNRKSYLKEKLQA